jgi:hypothetical protein
MDIEAVHFFLKKVCNISKAGPTRCTICFQFITINILYMLRKLICSSSGGTAYEKIGIFCADYVDWLLAGLECNILPE